MLLFGLVSVPPSRTNDHADVVFCFLITLMALSSDGGSGEREDPPRVALLSDGWRMSLILPNYLLRQEAEEEEEELGALHNQSKSPPGAAEQAALPSYVPRLVH